MLENKLPVKSDFQLLSKRKRAKAGCPGQESAIPAGPGSLQPRAPRSRPPGRGPTMQLQQKNPEWVPGPPAPHVADMLTRSLEK